MFPLIFCFLSDLPLSITKDIAIIDSPKKEVDIGKNSNKKESVLKLKKKKKREETVVLFSKAAIADPSFFSFFFFL
jgi:hypothetical protein